MIDQLVKLKALKKRCENSMKYYFSGDIPQNDFINYRNQFYNCAKIINENYPELFKDYQFQNYEAFYTTSNDYYSSHSGKALIDDITYYIDILIGLETIDLPNFKVTKEGIYFSGQYFDALLKLTDIMKSAKTSIILIDGYIDEKVLKIFSDFKSIQIKILTKAKSLSPSFETFIQEFKKQYPTNLEIKTSELFHDRFLIIDEIEFYHIGASIKDAGNKGFMFSQIEEPSIKKLLTAEFKKYWN